MNSANTRPVELLYEGSVKRVWKAPTASNRLWFEFTDDYSVFDWGKMPDTIENKGKALAVLGAYFFDRLAQPAFWQALPQSKHLEKFDSTWLKKRFEHKVYAGKTDGLAQKGAPSHFTGLMTETGLVKETAKAVAASDSIYMEVLEAAVHRPEIHNILHHSLYVYPQIGTVSATQSSLPGGSSTNGSTATGGIDDNRLVPLEIVFRFGMPGGSSLLDRLKKNPEYAKELGVEVTGPDKLFSHPVIEFYTKLESKDRLLSWQEASLMSALSGQQFEELVELALDTALALYVIFADKGVELWDGKFEMILYDGKLFLADSIGPDELRLLYRRCHLSKEIIRQVYRGTDWEVGLKEAQSRAKDDNTRSWKDIAVRDLKLAPQPLPSAFKNLIAKMYGALANHLSGKEVFAQHPTLDQFVDSLAEVLPRKEASPLTALRAREEK